MGINLSISSVGRKVFWGVAFASLVYFARPSASVITEPLMGAAPAAVLEKAQSRLVKPDLAKIRRVEKEVRPSRSFAKKISYEKFTRLAGAAFRESYGSDYERMLPAVLEYLFRNFKTIENSQDITYCYKNNILDCNGLMRVSSGILEAAGAPAGKLHFAYTLRHALIGLDAKGGRTYFDTQKQPGGILACNGQFLKWQYLEYDDINPVDGASADSLVNDLCRKVNEKNYGGALKSSRALGGLLPNFSKNTGNEIMERISRQNPK